MNKIQIYENGLDEDFRKELYLDAVFKIKDPAFYGWKTNYSWNNKIIDASHVVLSREYDEITKLKILENLIKNQIINVEDNLNYTVLNYAWTKLSYIPWHNDGSSYQTITIYLNDVWDENWGGIYLYNDDGLIKGIIPSPNRCVKNVSDLMHTVTPVNLNAPGCRITIQIFATIKDESLNDSDS
jgi:Rps23 Pro-64 3,4-dihydroxylase Tpa1-like proline 4-hydroxylase